MNLSNNQSQMFKNLSPEECQVLQDLLRKANGVKTMRVERDPRKQQLMKDLRQKVELSQDDVKTIRKIIFAANLKEQNEGTQTVGQKRSVRSTPQFINPIKQLRSEGKWKSLSKEERLALKQQVREMKMNKNF